MLGTRTERRQKARNLAQSALLLGSLLLVALGLAWLLVGLAGVIWLLSLTAVAVAVRRRVPTRAQLVMYRAQPLPYAAAPGLHLVVRELAERAGLPSVPTLYYLASPVPNALSAGGGTDMALAVTDGLLRGLLDREVIGVLAHEISHLRAGDAAAMTLADGIGRLARAPRLVRRAGPRSRATAHGRRRSPPPDRRRGPHHAAVGGELAAVGVLTGPGVRRRPGGSAPDR